MDILTFVEYKKCVSNKMASVDPKYMPTMGGGYGKEINKFNPPGGFKCPSPEELILLSDGSQKRAGDLVVGDNVVRDNCTSMQGFVLLVVSLVALARAHDDLGAI